MRRLITAGAALVVATGVVLALPVTGPSSATPEPVATSVHEVALGSVADPAPDVVVEQVPVAPAEGAPASPAEGAPAGRDVTPVPESAPAPTLRVRRPDVPSFSLVGVTWAYDPAVVDVSVRIRTRGEDHAWGEWTEIGVEDAGRDAGSAAGERGGTEPLWTGPSSGVEAEVTARSGAAPVDLELDLVNPGSSPADDVPGRPDIQDTADAAGAMPDVYSRAQWGANEAYRTWAPEYAGTIKAATIHHTAGRNGYAADEVPGILRGIYHYHALERKWGDIGYNVLADRFGRLWEGRAGGLASTVIGAHARNYNTYTFGVSMLGDYDKVDTTPALVDAVAAIVSWKLSLYGVDPRGTSTMLSPSGAKLPTVFAHSNVGSTACPGRFGYARMGEIRDKAAGDWVDLTMINARYDSDAAARTVLGTVVTRPTRTVTGQGGYADYTGGSLYYTARTNVRLVRGPVRDFWRKVGAERSVLQFPTADVAATADGVGEVGRFQGGWIFWSEQTGARTMMGPVGDFYRAVGAVRSPLGYPTQSVSWLPDRVGQYATFQGGKIFWSPDTGARSMLGGVGEFYSLVGGPGGPLGYPTRSVSWLPDGVGQFATFQNGEIFWSPDTGARTMMGPIGDLFASVGGVDSVLGYPTRSVSWLPDGVGQYATFEGGAIYWSPQTGARTMMGEIGELWTTSGGVEGALGYPTRSVSWLPDGVGQYATFQGGAIYSSPETGARRLTGPVSSFYSSVGGVGGPLGYPTSDVSTLSDGVGQYATFQGGAIYWSPETGTRTMMGEVGSFWTAVGGVGSVLGYPTRSVSWLPDRVGQFATFQGGSIYWSPTTGARTMMGPVGRFWSSVGGVSSPLGYPTRSVSWLPDRVGQYATFQGGAIYWSPQTGARTMMGPIGTFYSSVGGVGGPLGYPTRSVSWLPDRVGQYAEFQNGSIYWSPKTGARTMMGPVGDLWTSTGGVEGSLGYPTRSVSWLADQVGQYATFQGGAVWWQPATGAHVLTPAFLTAYRENGAEAGALGYPTRSAYAVRGGTRMDFERGTITVSGTGQVTVVLR